MTQVKDTNDSSSVYDEVSPSFQEETSSSHSPSSSVEAAFSHAENTQVASVVGKVTNKMEDEEGVSSRVFTIPNIITFIRLCMIPIFFVTLLRGDHIVASVLFALVALTDALDGFIARSTHSVSKLGQILDPCVDRLLMIAAVVGLVIVGPLPLWIVLVIVIRDVILLAGGSWLLFKHGIRIPVIYPGKVATTLLFVGFAGLMLNWPLISGLGWVSVAWLPGFNAHVCSWGIWFIYAGLIVCLYTTTYYIVKGIMALRDKKREALD